MSASQNNPDQPSRLPDSETVSQAPFSVAQQIEFTRKELRETLRDRRTIVTLIVMPLLLYPLLGLGFRFLAFQQAGNGTIEYRLAIETEAEANWVQEALQLGERALADPSERKPDVQFFLPDDPTEFDLEATVTESAADLGIRVQWEQASATDQRDARVQLLQNEASSISREALLFVERRLAAANVEWIRGRARQDGKDLSVPIAQSRVLLTPTESTSAILGLLPLILLLMTVTGGVYPAIDLTAGERERNTMETLMALPVPRFRLLAAKYVAVVTITMLTGLMNLLAMSTTLYALQLDTTLLGAGGFTIVLAVKLFLALTAFALFYSAVLLLLTSSARSFKEAQAYLIPLLLLSIAPGLVMMIPGWNLDRGTAAIPLVNILLLSRDLLEGTVQRVPAIVTVICTMLYGIAALSLAARVFGNDAVAVGSRGRWKDFLQRPTSPSQLPSLPSTLFTLAMLFPAYFIVSGILNRGEAPPTQRLALSAIMTVGLFVLIPWLLLRWQRVSRVRGLGLTSAAWPYLITAPIFGLTTWPWIFELVVLAQSMGIRGIDPTRIENVESLLAGWNEVPPWLVIVCLGVVPGICEECFFRGFLFNGLKQHLNAVGTISLSAIAFGLFHVVLAGGAAPERILPSTLMGMLLGWVAWKSGSSVPCILLHTIHNTTLLTVVQSRDLLAEWNIGQSEQDHISWWWLGVSAVVLAGATALIRFSTRLPRSHFAETGPESS